MDIKINKIEPETVEIFRNGEFFGIVNEYEFNDLRLQIAESSSIEFSLKFEDEFYTINQYGVVLDYPEGLFETLMDQAHDILKLSIDKRKKSRVKMMPDLPSSFKEGVTPEEHAEVLNKFFKVSAEQTTQALNK